MKINGVEQSNRLQRARMVDAHPTPKLLYMEVVAKHRTAPMIARVHADAAIAEAAKVLYESVK
jgi:hypothetical protein